MTSRVVSCKPRNKERETRKFITGDGNKSSYQVIGLVNIMDGHYQLFSILYGPVSCKWMPSLSTTVQIYITNLD